MKATRPSVGLEVALGVVTLAAVGSFVRLFAGWNFLLPLGIIAILGQVAAALTRRRGGPSSLPVMLAAGVAVVSNAALGHTTLFGIPVRATWDAGWLALTNAWHALSIVGAPTPITPGFLLACGIVVWLAAWSADRLAFSLSAPVEAMAPAATMFLFATLLSGPSYRLESAAVFACAIGCFMLVRRTEQLANRAQPVIGSISMQRANLGVGFPIVLAVVVCAVLAVHAVPGMSGPGVVQVRDRDLGGSTRSVVSPLVDIRDRLIIQSNTELFTVQASRPAYWRLMALDDFDGDVWSSNQSFTDAKGTLAQSADADFPVIASTARFSMTGLSGPWAPAPFRAVGVQGTKALLWDKASATLIVNADRKSVNSLTYLIRAELPDITSSQVRDARGGVPKSVENRDLTLPDDFPEPLRDRANRITANATTDFGKAMALQDYFRDSSHFSYSIEVAPGQGVNAMTSFLARGTGYCEQFAGTYAALARAAGLPSRVVVGFTSGDRDDKNPNLFRVNGRNAHAWPEVYISGVGWLPFEPTPGRGDPNAGYTGVAPQQAPPPGPSIDPVPAPTAPATSAPATTLAVQNQPTDQSTTLPAQLTATAKPPSDQSGPRATWLKGGLLGLGFLALVIGAIAASGRRNAELVRRRRGAAVDPAAAVLVAWTEVLEAWRPARLVHRAAETHRDFGERLAGRLSFLQVSDDVAAARRIAAISTTAAWQRADVSADQAGSAQRDAESLCEVADAQLTRWERFKVRFLPRGRTH